LVERKRQGESIVNPKWVSRLAWGIALLTIPLASATTILATAGRDSMSPGDWGSYVVMAILLPIYLGVGLVILHYRPGNRIGWLFLAVAFLFTLASFTREYALYGYRAGPWSGVRLSAWLSLFVNASFFLWFILLNLLYPDGRLVSPAWRWLVWLTVTTSIVLLLQELVRPGYMELYRWDSSTILPFTNPTGIFWLHALFSRIEGTAWSLSLLGLLVSGLAPVQRYRRGHGAERQQIKWLAYFWGISMVIIGLAALALVFSVTIPQPVVDLILSLIFIGMLAGFPIVVGLALLRYRLYDIDLIIRRTLIYGALTVSLTLIYFGSVIFLQEVLRSVTGNQGQSQPAIVISTLAVAAMFSPLRRRIQERIDLRFYRSRYDAERILDAFAEKARRETDLETLTGQLLEVVQNSLQPERVSIWLKGKDKE
jgi:hypothetical protein